MNADRYLERIGARRGDTLAGLQGRHVRAVPFENYDIHLGVPISLDPGSLHDKIVGRRRGGFCYELNGLFALLLRDLGFGVRLVSAFELGPGRTPGPDFEHLRLLVDGEWIVDVGDGARSPRPVPLLPGLHGDVQVHRDGPLWWTDRLRPDGAWEDGWAWTDRPRELSEFLPRCRYHEHDPASSFVTRRLAALVVEGGRIALLNGVFSETGQPDRAVGPAEERALLAERFGIHLPAGTW